MPKSSMSMRFESLRASCDTLWLSNWNKSSSGAAAPITTRTWRNGRSCSELLLFFSLKTLISESGKLRNRSNETVKFFFASSKAHLLIIERVDHSDKASHCIPHVLVHNWHIADNDSVEDPRVDEIVSCSFRRHAQFLEVHVGDASTTLLHDDTTAKNLQGFWADRWEKNIHERLNFLGLLKIDVQSLEQ